MENPIKMDDLVVPPFKETPIFGWWTFPTQKKLVDFGEMSYISLMADALNMVFSDGILVDIFTHKYPLYRALYRDFPRWDRGTSNYPQNHEILMWIQAAW